MQYLKRVYIYNAKMAYIRDEFESDCKFDTFLWSGESKPPVVGYRWP